MDQMYPVGQVGYSHRAISDRELHKTEFYAGWLKPHNADYCLGVLLKIPDRPLALLSAVRCAKHGAFEDEQGRIVEALYPHLQRALRLHCELSALRSAKQGLEHALDAFDRAVFGLNANGKILFSNRMADRLLEESDGIYVNRKRLAAAGPAQDMELQALLGEIAKTGAGFSGMGALLIPRRSGKPALRVTLMPFAGNFLRHFPGLTTLVFIDDPAKAPSSRATSLRKLFHLSPTQARLAALLAGGFQLAVAAEQLHMTQETARFHLKSIFMKTGVKRQVDLVRLWLNLPGEVTGTRCDGSSPGA
jgi:DNA-binding CsgD family transcriptional regulator